MYAMKNFLFLNLWIIICEYDLMVIIYKTVWYNKEILNQLGLINIFLEK